MATVGPVAGVDYPVPSPFVTPGQMPISPLVSTATGNIHYVKKAADTNYNLFFELRYQTLGDGSVSVYNTVQAAVTAAAAGDTIFIAPGTITAGGTDPVSYVEAVTIPAGKAGLRLIGLSNGVKQAGQPQIRPGTGSTALLTVRSPGCLIQGITFNGASATGGGILLDDDGSTKTTEGTLIDSCVFKNCKGAAATDGSSGGGVQIAASGGSWDTTVSNCLFYNNIGGFVLKGTSAAVPQDISIVNCRFDSSTAAGRDCDIWGNAGSGMVALNISYCFFGIFPAAGTKNNYMDLTNCTGLLNRCDFASNGKTFGAAANVLIPTTVGIAGNYQDGALIART